MGNGSVAVTSLTLTSSYGYSCLFDRNRTICIWATSWTQIRIRWRRVSRRKSRLQEYESTGLFVVLSWTRCTMNCKVDWFHQFSLKKFGVKILKRTLVLTQFLLCSLWYWYCKDCFLLQLFSFDSYHKEVRADNQPRNSQTQSDQSKTSCQVTIYFGKMNSFSGTTMKKWRSN